MRLFTYCHLMIATISFSVLYIPVRSEVNGWSPIQIPDDDRDTTVATALRGLPALYSLGDDITSYYTFNYGGLLPPLSLDHPDISWPFVFRDESVLANTTPSCPDWVYGWFPADISQKMTVKDPEFYPTVIDYNRRYYDPFSLNDAPFRFFYHRKYFGTWQILSRGPDGDFDILCEDLSLDMIHPSRYVCNPNKVFDPTNGLVSNGDIYPACIHDYYSSITTRLTLMWKMQEQGMSDDDWVKWIKEEEKKKAEEKK